VLVTAFGREEIREEAERLQLDGFLVKPVTKSMIVDTLVNVFAHATEQGSVLVEADQGVRLDGARILLTEDNEINQQIAVELLESMGAKIKVANNGLEAIEILFGGTHPPEFDVVLMDLQMPEMDGYQATAKIRADPRFATLPIIAMTAHATIEERQRCLASGMNDHVSKPIDPAMLFRFYKRSAAPVTSVIGSAPARSSIEPTDDIPPISGLDTNDGLTRVAGNRKLYTKLLHQFIEQQSSVIEQITAALAQGDSALAERLAHTLKGVAGNIGAKAVQQSAGALEKLIRDRADSAELEKAKSALSAALEPLLKDLSVLRRSAEASKHAPPPVTSVDPLQVRAAADQLAKLLCEFDASSADFIESNHSTLLPLFPGEAWQDFEKLVQAYAFGEAQTKLENALKTAPLE